MKKAVFSTCLLLLLTFKLNANTIRALYVDGFATILGDDLAENTLLLYAQNNGIEKLLLYELHLVNANHNLSYTSTNYILANFIHKAKTAYGILSIGAVAENAWFFTNVIDPYNNSRTDTNEKIDIYNLEFEYWNDTGVNPGGYYCNTYLGSVNYPCSNDGAFQFYLSTLDDMRTLAHNNSHPITTEAYLGWPTTAQAQELGSHLDVLLLHAYVTNPNTSFNYVKDRLINFANGTPNLNVSIIFSSEPNFMGDWLINNTMSEAENLFTTDWINDSATWSNNINLEGFTYFTYRYQDGIVLSTNSAQNISRKTILYPNPVQNTLHIENIENIITIQVYNSIGQLIKETKEGKINFNDFTGGVYFLKILSNNGLEIKKILKK
ncbi:hypothetical protein APS56_06275 [Pseudalgibacter alginicilyticus]|uniref:Secretion system C-terminal sorting domain-containing protein n=1 Tax=Pseudalgibacter alginicilyticus TaxID=1736674 RepID=A0A0P0CK28_9FLAO|nr:T9SS type A sorting domain-containing protein [Pseudalgibacter alginicilyticus]ALJ04754.1 hypothetical protein APS56_06275 [Pseudalgibacter alginicilyticus]